jgi:hypothetical protein
MGTRRGTCQNGNEPLTFTKDRIIVWLAEQLAISQE